MNVLGLVLFLEEDHYLSEDFLHVLKLMKKKADDMCTKCNILTLGTYLDPLDEYSTTDTNQVD